MLIRCLTDAFHKLFYSSLLFIHSFGNCIDRPVKKLIGSFISSVCHLLAHWFISSGMVNLTESVVFVNMSDFIFIVN